MRLGTRIALTTATMVIVTLAVYDVVTVRNRRAELASDVERETRSLGDAMQVALEADVQIGQFSDVHQLVRSFQEAEPATTITYVELTDPETGRLPSERRPAAAAKVDGGVTLATARPAGELGAIGATDEQDTDSRYLPPPPEADRDARLNRVRIEGNPYGAHEEHAGRAIYAYTLPLRDERDRVVALIDLVHEEGTVGAALSETERQVLVISVVLGVALSLFVWFSTRRNVTEPLRRLVEGIDEVSVGDLTRVILREREDEIGELADRFNQMTTSLREARAETERGLEAKLALEARLRHSEKLATIGQLAANIAHEVGTPLNVIGGRARAMERKSSEPTEVTKNAGIIAAQAERITKIIQQLLDYSRKKAAVRGPVDLRTVVADTVAFLEHQAQSSKVAVEVAPYRVEDQPGAPREPVVVADADQLQQVCINLCLNAIQSMPSGGQMRLGCRGEVRRKPGLDAAPPGRYVVLAVADDGVGINAEDRERIFEPFYSTKADSGGTGLGLAVSQGIVKDHDGWIEIEGRPQGGTLFRVFLPAPDEKLPRMKETERTDGTR